VAFFKRSLRPCEPALQPGLKRLLQQPTG